MAATLTTYLLDTNILIYLEESDSPFHQNVINNISNCTDEDVLAVSVLSFYELEYGIATRANRFPSKQIEQSQQALAEFQEGFQVLPLLLSASKQFAQLKTKYRTKFQDSPPAHAPKKHDIDFLIAATALDQDAVLISGDMIFEKLQAINPNLKLRNWTRTSPSFTERK